MRYRLFSLLLLLGLFVGCQPQLAPTPTAVPTAMPTATPTAVPLPAAQRLVVLPDDGVQPLLDLIDTAQHSIRCKIYLFTADDIEAALIRAAGRGVDVRVLIEQNPVGDGAENRKTFERLQAGGVRVRWAPAARYRLTHEKSLVVDDRRALIGTFNFTASAFRSNREYGLVLTDPALVGEIAAVFDHDWDNAAYERVRHPALVLSPLNSRRQIEALIDGATTELWLEQATLLDDAIAERLLAAARRGVTVRFLGPLRQGEEDLSLPNYRRLREGGAEVRRLAQPMVHAKVIVADGRRALVGSINLTRSSLELNRELGLITEDGAVIERLLATLQRDWAAARPLLEAPTGVIPWQEAGRYVGSEVVVEGAVVRTYDSGRATFLNFTQDWRGTFTVVIFASAYNRFPERPRDLYRNRLIRVRGVVQEYQGTPEIIVESPAQIEILGEVTAAEAAAPSAAELPVISWQEAGRHIGEVVIVEGTVVRTYDSGRATFLNFTQNWRGTFTVVIFAGDYERFPLPPKDLYNRQTIRVRGRIKEYQGAPEIVVESPDQIEIVSAAVTPTPAPTPIGIVPWQEAGRYVGRTVTVEGRIVNARDIGTITFLNFSPARDRFVVVVFAEDYPAFPAPPVELYAGKKVWVTGEITLYRGVPQIILRSPTQIEVFP